MGTQTQLLRSIRETAGVLAVSPDTVRRLIAQRELRAVRVSRRILVSQVEIDRVCAVGTGSPRRRPAVVIPKRGEGAEK